MSASIDLLVDIKFPRVLGHYVPARWLNATLTVGKGTGKPLSVFPVMRLVIFFLDLDFGFFHSWWIPEIL